MPPLPAHAHVTALLLSLAGALSTPGCTGRIGEPLPARGPGGDTLGEPADSDGPPAVSALRRLSRAEYESTVRDLLRLDEPFGTERLPEDSTDPFDNDYTTQAPSNALVDAFQAIAEDAVALAFQSQERRTALVPCAPTGPGDAGCLRRFIETFGRRALRRPLREEEIQDLLTFQSFATDPGPPLEPDFYAAPALVVRTLLQMPELLYRAELGTPVDDAPGLYRLDDYEVASRLSYFLWGTTPDDALLDLAGQGRLVDAASRRTIAEQMLEDPRARRQVERFHSMWLGYQTMSVAPDLAVAMRRETAALLEDVIFERRAPYTEVFLANRTYVAPALAEHYGLTAPTGSAEAWIDYRDTGRAGILSHGTVLSAFSKPNDTSPTLRGKFIRERLMCQEIPPPPPNVNTDMPPVEANDSPCKWDRYVAHRTGGCASCHDQMDPVGFGLENFDRTGQYRSHDDGLPECEIEGRGELRTADRALEFSGPGELGARLVESGTLQACAVRQIFRHAVGRRDREPDDGLVKELQRALPQSGAAFTDYLLAIVGSEWFAYRRDDEED